MIISTAQAASHAVEKGAEVAHHGGILHDPTFWVAVSFLLYVIAIYVPVKRGLKTLFNVRAEKIKNKISEARELREQTQRLLAEYEKKLHNAQKESEEIVTNAHRNAENLRKVTLETLEQELVQKEKQAMLRISTAESSAIEEIRNHITNISIEVTKELLKSNIDANVANVLIEKASKELPNKISEANKIA